MSPLTLQHDSPSKPTTEYGELKRLIREQGLLAPQPRYYAARTAVTGIMLAIAITIAVFATNPWLIIADAVFLGFVSTQIAFLAHDAGHRQGFRGRVTNAIARYGLGNLVLGISQSWWNNKHNQHHATPNHTDDDPDIQFPMIVFSADQLNARPQWLRPFIAVQAFIFPLLLPAQALNMRITSAFHIFKGPGGPRWGEAALVGLHLALYGALVFATGSWPLAVAFFAIHQATFGVYNSSVFATNHKGMPLTDGNENWGFLRDQVLTARDVRAHPMLDFWSGGLNYQIEHHLFPTMPRNRLRRAQAIVQAFCADRGIPHQTTGVRDSYAGIFRHLHEVSAPLRRRKRALPASSPSQS